MSYGSLEAVVHIGFQRLLSTRISCLVHQAERCGRVVVVVLQAEEHHLSRTSNQGSHCDSVCIIGTFYRQDCRIAANCRYCFYPQATGFYPQGRLVAPIQVKLCSTDGHLGPLGCAKFHVNRCRGVGMRPPKHQKFPLFGRVAPQGRLR